LVVDRVFESLSQDSFAMLDTLLVLPISFWMVVVVCIVGGLTATARIRDGIGVPMLAVLGTVAAWYVGDALYNDYAENHAEIFSKDVLSNAWWEVAWFLIAFLLLAPRVHRLINSRYLGATSRVTETLHVGVEEPHFQSRMKRLLEACVAIWAILAAIAAIRLGGDILFYFFPFLGPKADPWGRARVGGDFDAWLSLAGYFQLAVASLFGVVAALAKDARMRTVALVGCAFTWPYYIFDRTRNTMLAAALPAVLAWAFLRLRGGLLKKLIVLAGFFVVIEGWMTFVIGNRSTISISAAIYERGTTDKQRHLGLNMFEELCWISTLMQEGAYTPNWGERYFAEIVNPIPRAIWPDKPFIGIDYAEARGQAGGDDAQAGVNATISTGMIGQGVVNFGRVWGPAFAALLMSIWVAILARLDLRGHETGCLQLYALGIVLTFNLGRDITLITLYTFIFGWTLVWYLNWSDRRAHPGELELELPARDSQ
jgi:hypothetical protein